MAVRLSVAIGPALDALDQVLEIDIDDLLEVLERLGQSPMVWQWELPAGDAVQLTAWISDPPGESPTPEL